MKGQYRAVLSMSSGLTGSLESYSVNRAASTRMRTGQKASSHGGLPRERIVPHAVESGIPRLNTEADRFANRGHRSTIHASRGEPQTSIPVLRHSRSCSRGFLSGQPLSVGQRA
jgi:hypothetical protein